MAKMAVNPEQIIALCSDIQNDICELETLYAKLRDKIQFLNDEMRTPEYTQHMAHVVNESCLNSFETMKYTKENIGGIIEEMNMILGAMPPLPQSFLVF